ncbi:hypothetical protein HDU99_005378, partial [Rhizoclosmatium hyalinum]
PSDKRAVLADFGLSTTESTHTTYSKRQGPTFGHACYAPPEAMLPGYKPLTSYDVFSFAMIMYYVKSRHWPFEGTPMIENQFAIAQWIQQKERPNRSGTPNYSRKIDNISDDSWNLMERCWSHIHTERPTLVEICSEIK